jgi:hypothetical protein
LRRVPNDFAPQAIAQVGPGSVGVVKVVHFSNS